MAKFPEVGISEEEITREFNYITQRFIEAHIKFRVYSDVPVDIETLAEAKKPISEDMKEIYSKNLVEYIRRVIQMKDLVIEFECLKNLYQKYFPDSVVLNNPSTLEKISKIEELVKTSRKRVDNLMTFLAELPIKSLPSQP